jgi:hypothetical protein
LLLLVAAGHLLLLFGVELDPPIRFFLYLATIAVPLFAVFVGWKTRRAYLAATRGRRGEARVLAIRLHRRNEDAEDSYVLVWSDPDGIVGQSQPATFREFSGLKKGDRVFIYHAETGRETWWERDLFGQYDR